MSTNTTKHRPAMALAPTERMMLGKAAYRGFFALLDSEADDAWEQAEWGQHAIGRTDYESAAVEVINAMADLPADVRAHIAASLMDGVADA